MYHFDKYTFCKMTNLKQNINWSQLAEMVLAD